MVLRKPYAFLIKHFRMIHLLLLIPMLYLILKTRGIVNFFVQYVAGGYSLNFVSLLDGLSSNYINIFMYLAVIIILVTFIVISLLLQNKDKPTKFYNMAILYYIGIFLIITACFNVFGMIEDNSLTSVAARIIRDLSYLVHYSQYVFVAFTVVRGVGFNIKQFDFKSDLANLEISSEDDEEFEFLVGTDTYKTKRAIRRFFRELTYYYKENKFIFNIIIVVVVGILGTILYMNRQVYDRVYKENESLSFGKINVIVKDSYISNLNKKGKVIDEDKTYLVLQLEIKNRFREDQSFNYPNFQLLIGKEYVSPNISIGNLFLDFGNPFSGTLIKGDSDNNYILVYELTKKQASSRKINVVAYSRYDTTPGGLGAVVRTINIKPTTISSKVVINNINKTTNVNLKATNLKDTTATIIDYELTNRFEYNYEYCTNNTCYTRRNDIAVTGSELGRYTLLVLDYDIVLDSSSSYMYSDKDYKSFFEDFMQIRYKVDGRDYNIDVSLVPTSGYTDKMIMKVPNNINRASSIEAIIVVRNVGYSIKLK